MAEISTERFSVKNLDCASCAAKIENGLRTVEGVDEASAVYGVYDIVARVKADTMDKLKEIVTWRIRRLDKVRSTLTMIVVEDR